MLTPVSEDSSVEMVTLSPPQISPFSQLSETASDTSAPEITEVTQVTKVISLSIKSSSLSDSSATNRALHADDNKEPKRSKAHLHCPVCKVTMNSVSQLDAHNSGTSATRHDTRTKCFQKLFTFAGEIVFSGLLVVPEIKAVLSVPGTKHKLTLEGHAVLPRRRGKVAAARGGCRSKRLGSKGSVGVPSKTFQCEACEIVVNSESQLSQVM